MKQKPMHRRADSLAVAVDASMLRRPDWYAPIVPGPLRRRSRSVPDTPSFLYDFPLLPMS